MTGDSPNFTETEKTKQNEKTEEFVSNERSRKKKKWKKTTNGTEINNLPDKQLKALVIRMLLELGKRIDKHGTFLVAQLLRIRLPVQGIRVRALVQEDPTCSRATKPVCHNY